MKIMRTFALIALLAASTANASLRGARSLATTTAATCPDHSSPPPGESAPFAWKKTKKGKRNMHNRFEKRIATTCCSSEATTVLSWPDFLAAQPCDAAMEPVTIPCGTRVELDGADLGGEPIALKGLYVEGELSFVDSGVDVELRSDFIFNCGKFHLGDPATGTNFEGNVDLVLTGTGPLKQRRTLMWRGSDFGQTGFVTYGGETVIRGASCDKTTWSRLATTAKKGATELEIQDGDHAWQEGDKLLVVTTDWGGPKGSEFATVAAVEGRAVRLAEPLKRGHLGCEKDGEDEHVPGIPCTLAGEVAPLSRNIRVMGEQDCKADKLCGHFVIAHTNTGMVCGAEFTRMGQKTTKGRYPIHLHMGGVAPNLVVKGNSVHDNFNRGIVVHAVNRANILDNTCHNTLGHCFLLEDGVEQHNKLVHNLGHRTRAANWGCKSSHDQTFRCGDRGDFAPNAFWLPNLNNYITDNVGVQGGVAFRIESRHVMGDTRLWFHPEAMRVGNGGKLKHSMKMPHFINNVAHSSDSGFFNYPHLNFINGCRNGYKAPVAWRNTRGIFVKNTSMGGALVIKGAKLILNHWAVYAQTPGSRVKMIDSHVLGGLGGNGSNLPFHMKGRGKSQDAAIKKTFGKADAYTREWGRCHGGYTHPSAKSILGKIKSTGASCDAAPAKFFAPYVENEQLCKSDLTAPRGPWQPPAKPAPEEPVPEEPEADEDEDAMVPDEEIVVDDDEDDVEGDDDEEQDVVDDEEEVVEEEEQEPEVDDSEDPGYDDDDDAAAEPDIAVEYPTYTTAQLRQLLKRMGLRFNGNRKALLARIAKAIKYRTEQGMDPFTNPKSGNNGKRPSHSYNKPKGKPGRPDLKSICKRTGKDMALRILCGKQSYAGVLRKRIG